VARMQRMPEENHWTPRVQRLKRTVSSWTTVSYRYVLFHYSAQDLLRISRAWQDLLLAGHGVVGNVQGASRQQALLL
jgi:hypothetical protein